MTITVEDYLTEHAPAGTAPGDVVFAANALIPKINALLADPGCPVPDASIRSGWRPAEFNKTVAGAAPNSKHITGNAVDLSDPDALLDDWLDLYDVKIDGPIRNEILEKYGLWRENSLATKSWCHLQDLPPKSGNRTFVP